MTRAEAEEDPAPDAQRGALDNLTSEVVGKGRVRLDWNDVAGTAEYGVLFYATTDCMELPVDDIDIVLAGSSAMVSGLPDDDFYYFKVRAGQSGWCLVS